MSRILFLIACLFTLQLRAGDVLNIPRLDEQPVIDGKFDEPVWHQIQWQSGFTRNGTASPAEAQTRFKVFHDGRTLYLAVEADEPAMDKMVRREYQHDSNLIWRNDSIELSLVPDPKAFSFYKLIIDSAGVCSDMLCVDDNTDRNKYNFFHEWESSAQIKTSHDTGKWLLEAAIPLGAMDFNSQMTNQWRFNVARNRYTGQTAEMSSWSPLPTPAQTAPKSFRSVELEKLPLKRFLLEIEGLASVFDRRKDGSFVFTASATIHNRTGGFALVTQRLNLGDGPDGKCFTGNAGVNIHTNAFKKSEGSIEGVTPGKYRFNYELWSSGSAPYLLKRVSLPVNLEYMPLSVKLIRPAYRNNLYATMPDKTVEALIVLHEGGSIPLTAELLGENHFRKTKNVTDGNRIEFDASALPDGHYTLRVSGERDGKKWVSEVKLRKLPYRKGEVWLDRSGVVHVDGKPFLPYGWYGTRPERPGSWFNNVLSLARFAAPEDAIAAVQANLEAGQRTLLFPFQDLDPRGWVPSVIFKDPDARKNGLNEAQRRKIKEFVGKVSKSDGLLAWYMADEPEGRDNNPLFYEEAHELIAELDPYHPCVMLNYGVNGMRKYYKGCDILMPDCYPQYFEDGSTGKVLWSTSEWMKTATSLRPSWFMPQMTPWPAYSADRKLRGVAPDYLDQRSQIFQALIYDAKGFNLYAWHYSQTYSALIIGPDEIGKTLAVLKEYLLAPTAANGVQATTTPEMPQFQVGLKELDGRFCVIAVNTSRENVNVKFKLKMPFDGELAVAGENRSIPVRKGVFTDRFVSKATHVYLTDAKLANAVPSVQGAIDAINAHRAARRKPGNLIARGEMLEAQYLEYGAGKIPPEVPKLKASSDAAFHGTAKTGSLYYLLDGLTEPNRIEYSWSPKASDKQPYLEITLPHAAPLRELKLYTPNGNLTACRVLVNGKVHEVKDNRGEVISIPLGGETADRLRLEIVGMKPSPADNGKPAGKRLLTEIELY